MSTATSDPILIAAKLRLQKVMSTPAVTPIRVIPTSVATDQSTVVTPIRTVSSPAASTVVSPSVAATSTPRDQLLSSMFSGPSASELTTVTGPDGSTFGIVGDPTSLQAPASTATNSATTSSTSTNQTMNMLGAAAGVAAMVQSLAKNGSKFIPSSISKFLAQAPVSIGLSAFAAGMGGYSLFTGVQSMFKNGFSVMGAISTGMSLYATAAGTASLLTSIFGSEATFLFGLSALPMGFIIAGAIVLIAVLVSLFGGTKASTTPSAAEQPLVNFPSVWTNGPVMFITAGMSLMAMGINLSPTAPMISNLAVPTVALTTALNGSGLSDQSGTASASYSKYNTLFVEQDPNGGPDHVMIVTPGTSGMDNVTTYTIKNNLKVTSPSDPKDAYIPFFIRDSKGNTVANPDAVQAIQAENALTTAANSVTNGQGTQALSNAGAVNKYGTVSSGAN